MTGYQALQVAVEEQKEIQFKNNTYRYINDTLLNQQNESCTIPFNDLMAKGWNVKEEVLI